MSVVSTSLDNSFMVMSAVLKNEERSSTERNTVSRVQIVQCEKESGWLDNGIVFTYTHTYTHTHTHSHTHTHTHTFTYIHLFHVLYFHHNLTPIIMNTISSNIIDLSLAIF